MQKNDKFFLDYFENFPGQIDQSISREKTSVMRAQTGLFILLTSGSAGISLRAQKFHNFFVKSKCANQMVNWNLLILSTRKKPIFNNLGVSELLGNYTVTSKSEKLQFN